MQDVQTGPVPCNSRWPSPQSALTLKAEVQPGAVGRRGWEFLLCVISNNNNNNKTDYNSTKYRLSSP